jgi:secreted protein with Ig-like and vWFA domain
MKHEEITAWALEELTPEARAHLEEQLAHNPEIRQKARETKQFCDLLVQELRDDSLELTPAQRQSLKERKLARNVIRPTLADKPPRWGFVPQWMPLTAAAACIALGGYWMYPLLQPKKPATVAGFGDEAPSEKRFQVQLDSSNPASASADFAILSPQPLPGLSPTVQSSIDPLMIAPGDGLLADSAQPLRKSDDGVEVNSPIVTLTPPARGGFGNGMPGALPGVVASEGSTFSGGVPVAPARTAGTVASLDGVRDRTASGVVEEESLLLSKPRGDVALGEGYASIAENELREVLQEPLSTFSIDVDTASYANVRRFLNQNLLPPRDAVRIEELVNYFPSSDAGPAPAAKEPFAVKVEMAACPWHGLHQLARISVQGRQVAKSTRASNLVFLVDVSGSMNEPQKLPLLKESLRMLVQQLGENDRVSLVTYADGTRVVLPPTNGQNRAQILTALDSLEAGGSTNGTGGLQRAYEQAADGFVSGGINRVILCTDGDFNVGISDPAQLKDFISLHAKNHTFLSVLGFGSGNLQDDTMETLADAGNGNYAYIDGLAEARKVLVEQMQGTLDTIAKDVKIQVEFNPAVVRAYRLIGYENRLLAKEDFNDDRKDAGEIGAGHSVVALYEIVPANLPPGEEPGRIVDTLKYQTLTSPTKRDLAESKASVTAEAAGFRHEAMTVKLRYKQPEDDVSSKVEIPVTHVEKPMEQASQEWQFSAAVAGFGLLLRDSPFKGTLDWELVRKLALTGKGTDAFGYRGEFLRLIDQARGLQSTAGGKR